MFTGIIEDIGTISALKRKYGQLDLTVESALICSDLKVDDSVALNGVCLTVTDIEAPRFTVQAGYETLLRSTLERWTQGRLVNLERAVRADSRLGGHIVQGHVDTVSRVLQIREHGQFREFSFSLPGNIYSEVIEKGSIAVDGVSLTVSGKLQDRFSVSLIPHTLKNTLFRHYRSGTEVNLETDILGKYVLESLKNGPSGLNRDRLKSWGYEDL